MGRVLCSGDWHGCGKVAEMVFDFLQDDDVLFYLGDAVDRGPNGLELFDRLYKDSRVIFLEGNHEEMMKNAIEEEFHVFPLVNWLNNGGSSTFDDLEKESEEEQKSIVNKIKVLPTEFIYHSPLGHSVIMEHSGFTPFSIPRRTHNPLWDREHFDDMWDGGYEYRDLNPKNTYLIHGHTPVQFLHYYFGYNGQDYEKDEKYFKAKRAWNRGSEKDIKEFCPKPQILHYCDGHKINVDMCTVASNRIALIDLNTFEEFYFDCEE
jgi:serine/threonine protein phosphatase 1